MHQGLIRPYSYLLVQLNRLLDVAWIGLTLALVLGALGARPTPAWLALGAAGMALFAIVAEVRALYRSWRIAPLHDELSIIWQSWAIVALLLVAGLYFLGDAPLGVERRAVAWWLAGVPLVLSVTRLAVRLALRAGRLAGRNFRRAAVAGATDIGLRTAARLAHNRWMGLRLVGFFDDRDPNGERPLVAGDVPVLGDFRDLVERARAGEIDVVYVGLPMRAEERVRWLVEQLADTTVSVYLVPDLTTFDLLHAQWENLGDVPILRLVDSPFGGFNAVLKRAQDVALSVLILAVCAVPMALIALAIRLDSPGPVLYRQRRHGLDGREFVIWKFRTMTASEAHARFRQATRADPRVTRVGRWLRRTSLDELPQFINVLQGRMSIVGPRPHPIALNDQYRRALHRFMLRHKVRPGITGWAQVHGLRGETDTPEKMRARLEYDLEYIHNWSLWLDLRIMVMTVFRVLADDQAY